MKIKCFPFGPLQANAYLLTFGKEAFLIDPCVRMDHVDIDGSHIRGIFLTHGHFDHLSEANTYRHLTGAVVMAHELDCPNILSGNTSAPFPQIANISVEPPLCPLKDGDVLRPNDFGFELAEDVEIRVIHTPGHSKGSMCLLVVETVREKKSYALFSGDTLFADTIGRTDLDGSMEEMQRSLIKLSRLPDDVIVYPGHGPSTTIGREKRQNPYFTAIL